MRDTYWKIWDEAQEDPQYRLLFLRLQKLDRDYEQALLALNDAQRETVCDYVALCEAMSERMLEIACEKIEEYS